MSHYGPGISKWGFPNEMVSCPGCGNIYGRYNRTVCQECDECSKCCNCTEQKLVSADEMVDFMQKNGSL